MRARSSITGERSSNECLDDYEGGYVFLSKDWIIAFTRAVEEAKRSDEKFNSLTRGFTLTLKYIVVNLPGKLEKFYNDNKVVIFMHIVEGILKKLVIGPEAENMSADFTVESDYDVAKSLFSGDLNPGTAFTEQKIKVSPLANLYRDPSFTARAIITANAMLKIASKIPTVFV